MLIQCSGCKKLSKETKEMVNPHGPMPIDLCSECIGEYDRARFLWKKTFIRCSQNALAL
jgi:hypothetical protein